MHFHVTDNPAWQIRNYESFMLKCVIPFEAAGYEVDVFIATYSTRYDALFNRSFHGHLKVFLPLDRRRSSQASSAYASLQIFDTYAVASAHWYRFVVFTRHDVLFTKDLAHLILPRAHADSEVLTSILKPKKSWCRRTAREVFGVQDAKWLTPDLVYVFPGKLVGCFMQLMYSPPGKASAPAWMFECLEPWMQHLRLVNASINFAGNFYEVCGEERNKGLKSKCM